eukprot:4422482-Amphidinium_carterae.1
MATLASQAHVSTSFLTRKSLHSRGLCFVQRQFEFRDSAICAGAETTSDEASVHQCNVQRVDWNMCCRAMCRHTKRRSAPRAACQTS